MSYTEIERKIFNSTDEKVNAGKVKSETVKTGDYTITRSTMELGASWSKDIKPIVKNDRCDK
tara:strand:- start:116 stop:301 length:186 start_codon:yes stop_codon:yes gene_type:complete